MEGDNLEYWNSILLQKTEDLQNERLMDIVNDDIIKVLQTGINEATKKINELS